MGWPGQLVKNDSYKKVKNNHQAGSLITRLPAFFVNFTKEIYNHCNLYGSVIAGTCRHIYNKYRNEVRPPQGAGRFASYV